MIPMLETAPRVRWVLATLSVCAPAGLGAQELNPATAHAFDCYVQSAEARLDARKAFLAADWDADLNDRLVRGQRVEAFPANGANPHKLPSAHLL